MRLVGANWLSSRFTFVVCRPPMATCRGEIELQGIGRRQRSSYRAPGGLPTEVSIMNDCNETVNNSHLAGFTQLCPATVLVVLPFFGRQGPRLDRQIVTGAKSRARPRSGPLTSLDGTPLPDGASNEASQSRRRIVAGCRNGALMRRPATMFDRDVALSKLTEEIFDVVVVGGGITGAGVALDAASRGLRTALVERGDFASGTSSKSSKMVHGGLRYLQQHDFGLVRQSLNERRLLLQNAPHLVEPLTLLVPLFGKGGAVDRATARAYSTALWMYDLAGGWRIGKRHHRITAEELASHFPTLRTDNLVAGFVYYDAWADDARLTLAVLRTAVLEHAAVAVNYTPVVGLVHDDASHLTGVRVAPFAANLARVAG